MDTLCDYGGGIVEALSVNVYGNGTEALVLAYGFVFSPKVNPDLYYPKKYSNFNGYVQDLLCLLDQLNLNVNKTIYVDHSMSAMIGCIAPTKRPKLFQHLILLSGSPSLVLMNIMTLKNGFERGLGRMNPKIALGVAKTVFLSDLRIKGFCQKFQCLAP
ncbi:strigolactone esterase D14-like [Fagus crenata]